MPGGRLHAVIGQLRRLIGRESGCKLTDAQLLDDFVGRRDEASFEVLVWRHGTMVLELCRRVLRDDHEAEDAFQATFLVFARKAGSIGKRESVGSWLYKVAYRVALRARGRAAHRSGDELPADLPAPQGPDDLLWRDLRPVLDEEIHRLPEKYRTPFVLCYLEGHTNEEAAEQIGCPKGTVLSRLARGRERLRCRLSRRGVTLSAAGLVTVLSQNAAPAAVPAALVSPTAQAALAFAAGKAANTLVPASVAALTEGVLRTMFLTKLKIALATLLAVVVIAPGAGLIALGTQTEKPPARVSPPVAEKPAPILEEEVADFTEPAEDERRVEQKPAREPARAEELAGQVTAVGKDGKSFTVEFARVSRGERGAEVKTSEIKIGDKTTVTYQAVGPDGAKPTRGYRVQVRLVEGSRDTAAGITFSGAAEGLRPRPNLTGRVAGVSRDGKTFTVEQFGRGRDREAQTVDVKLGARSVVVFQNVRAGAARITEGLQAAVWLEEDSRDEVHLVQFQGNAVTIRRDDPQPDAIGRVAAVSKDGKTLTVEVRSRERREEPARLEVKIGDRTTVVFGNVPPGGARLAEGMQVRLWLAEGSKTSASRVALFGTVKERDQLLTGRVTGFSKDGKTFTLEQPGRRGDDTPTLDVKFTEKTKVTYNGVGTGEAKLTEGYYAQVRLKDGSKDTAAAVVFVKPGSRGRR
jgi:RNA polymerase sigma factor (sigma-70 family)